MSSTTQTAISTAVYNSIGTVGEWGELVVDMLCERAVLPGVTVRVAGAKFTE